MKIELESYEHTCEDGCCYTTGYDVFVDGEKIGHTLGEDAYELVELLNEHFDNDKEKDSRISLLQRIIEDESFYSSTGRRVVLVEDIRSHIEKIRKHE